MSTEGVVGAAFGEMMLTCVRRARREKCQSAMFVVARAFLGHSRILGASNCCLVPDEKCAVARRRVDDAARFGSRRAQHAARGAVERTFSRVLGR